MKDFTVVIATQNEADNIKELITEIRNIFGTNIPLIIVDNDSKDETSRLAQKAIDENKIDKSRIIVTGNKSISENYIIGLKAALKYNTRYIIQMDAGLTHNPHNICNLINTANLMINRKSLVIGSRFCTGYRFLGKRTILSRLASFAMRLVGVKIYDVSSGFRCWSRELLKTINFDNITAKGFAFQLQMLYEVYRPDVQIREVKIDYKLTNSSLNSKMIFEAIDVIFCLFLKKYFGEKK